MYSMNTLYVIVFRAVWKNASISINRAYIYIPLFNVTIAIT